MPGFFYHSSNCLITSSERVNDPKVGKDSSVVDSFSIGVDFVLLGIGAADFSSLGSGAIGWTDIYMYP